MSLPPFNHWEFLLLRMSRMTARLILVSLRTLEDEQCESPIVPQLPDADSSISDRVESLR